MGCSFPIVTICIKKMAHQCLGIFGTIIVAPMGSELPHAWSSGPGSSPGQGYWTGLGWTLITGALNHKSYMMLAHFPSESYLILLIHTAFHLHGLYEIYSGAPAEHHNYRERNHKYASIGNHATLFFYGQKDQRHGSRASAPNNDDVAQHGGHPPNTSHAVLQH